MRFDRLALIGCGLMGGSFALAAKQAGIVGRVVGFSPSSRTTERAVQAGVIDEAAPSAADAVAGAELVLLAMPVAATGAVMQSLLPQLSPNALMMDVGSTKADVVAAARANLQGKLSCFVPAHPICGREVSGVEHADAQLYAGSHVILTPLPDTPADQLDRAQAVWEALGCHVSRMAAEAHDAAFGAVSHFPHLMAFAFINSLLGQDQGAQFMGLGGSGFRDSTRIAASEPTMWRDILLANREQVLLQSQQLRAQLQALESLLQAGDGDALKRQIEQASWARAQWQPLTRS